MTEFDDPEFLRIYYSGDKEWPGYEAQDFENTSLPLLISEIFRLIPFVGPDYIYFHPKNMPEIVIERVEIIGIVTDKTMMTKYTSYTVDDSTGAISVLCMNEPESDDDSTSEESEESSDDETPSPPQSESELQPPYELAPEEPYSYDRHIQNLWHRARDEEPLHDEIVLYDYVHVIGFCGMTFRNQKEIQELTDEDIKLGRLFFFGLNARRISESEHNKMLKTLIAQVAYGRYLKPAPGDATTSQSEDDL